MLPLALGALLAALLILTPASAKDRRHMLMLTPSERNLMAKLVLAEAGTQPYLGKVAVASVVLNRANEGGYGDGIKGVIAKPKQFEPVSTGAINKYGPDSPGWDDAQKAIDDAIAGKDPTGGATHFLNKSTTRARGDAATRAGGWGNSMVDEVKIGQHWFGKGDAGRGDGTTRIIDTGTDTGSRGGSRSASSHRSTLAALGLEDDEAANTDEDGDGGSFDLASQIAALQNRPIRDPRQALAREMIGEILGHDDIAALVAPKAEPTQPAAFKPDPAMGNDEDTIS